MAFENKKLAPVGAVSPAVPTIWSYRTDDTLAEVLAANYFDDARNRLRPRDLIYVNASDGDSFINFIGFDVPAVFPVIPAANSFVVVEADSNYQALIGDDAINCDGTFTVTLPLIADAVKPIIISSTTGSITLASDATIQGGATVNNGTSVELYPSRGQWWAR